MARLLDACEQHTLAQVQAQRATLDELRRAVLSNQERLGAERARHAETARQKAELQAGLAAALEETASLREQLAAERRVGTELAQLVEKQRWQYDQLNARFKFMRAAGEQDAGPEHQSPDATVVERRGASDE